MVIINNLTFNQDHSCISLSTSGYYKIFNCDPFGEFYSSSQGTIRKSISNSVDNDNTIQNANLNESSPTAYLKMLFSTSLTIIVPQSEGSLGNRLLKIFNLKQNLKICELTFPSNIIDIKLNRKRLVVFLEIGQIYIYDLSCVRLVKVLEINCYPSPDNKESIVECIGDLSADDRSFLVLPLSLINESTDLFNSELGSQNSTPSIKPSDSTVTNSLEPLIEFTNMNINSKFSKGDSITLDDLQRDSEGWVLVYDTLNLKPMLIYKAHNSSIAKIATSNDGSKVATASSKGTIIRISHLNLEPSESGILRIVQITNLRRGHNLAKINVLSFNADNSILGCGSESNTIHFFRVNKTIDSSEDDVAFDGDVDEDSTNSTEDLNENLANLLISKPNTQEAEKSSYFRYGLRKTSKMINNQYTKSLLKRLPYTDYIEKLIWEPPKRSFAYIKLPEYTPTHNASRNKVEIGFNSSLVLIASYQTGLFYHYHLPKEIDEYKRHEGNLINQYDLFK